ncbi:hypothetical protein QV08_04805 [Gallibacterium salpingitidis]|uniref:Transcriptional regulator n=1 Tax=Gallibacterium salpingitidis TaxID=505341 RepID=A0AB36E432_9PAST|nr:hypothetical protein [Gallibacterium salpingitidis]OBX08526.1 hypothetical protein QV08_04805 [Gallibacterium salpingitidis]OBX11618.1 hypothetical protein QV09_01800 [Gallibacterium salpingitidis]WKS99027.1 transcriptional regulator [Gallibacterium salpingitidis]
MALTIKCPFCGSDCRIRTSDNPSLLTVKAQIYCANCNELKADFIGQITNVKRAIYIDCPEAQRWEKPEKELIREQGKKPISNDERIQYLKRGEAQPDLFQTPPKKPLTPLERIERREKLCHS